MPLPLDPEVLVTGIDGPSAHVFKSAMMPLGLTFRTVTGGEYKIIFKNGDDLRQDQLILQQILLMDGLLKRENLDLMLTPYKCLATRCGSPATTGALHWPHAGPGWEGGLGVSRCTLTHPTVCCAVGP